MLRETDRPWQRYLAVVLLTPIVYVGVFAGPAVLATKLSVIVLCISFAFVPRRWQETTALPS
jgi:hypothetical protein